MSIARKSTNWHYYVLLLTVPGVLFAQPSIDTGRVLNTSGNQAKLSPGLVWVIYGKNLGPAALTAATGPNYPLSVGGTSVTFAPAAGGTAINAKIWYSLATQVGGFLPSTAAPGTYRVSVTYSGQTSLAQNVTVVARSMGIATSNGIGTGPAQATIANVNGGLSLVRYTTGSVDFGGFHWILTPAHPGDEVVLWGTGGGADPANDPGPSSGSSGDQTKTGNIVVTVGTRQITPDYAGTVAGFPGLWQINVHLPSDIDLDCFAPVQVSANGEAGNLTSIAIAAAGQSVCSDSQFPLSLLTKLDSGQNIINGVFAIARVGTAPSATFQESASGLFGRYTPAAFVAPRIGPKFNGCEIYDRTFAGGADPGNPDAFLDAGSRLPISGPNLTSTAALTPNATATGPVYALSPPNGTFTGAAYNLSGTGGAVVGPFSATVNFPNSFTGANWDAITVVDRSKPLTFNWVGSGFDQVYILVNSITTLGASRRIVSMNCIVPSAPGTYTIPPAALAYMPPVPASGTSFGSIALEAHGLSPVFTAPLVGGGQTDFGVFASDLGYSKNVAIQ